MANTFRPVRRVIDSVGPTSSVRLIPSGVSSKAQAKISAIGKLDAIAATKTFITHAGASNVGNKIVAAWSSSHETTTYAIATL